MVAPEGMPCTQNYPQPKKLIPCQRYGRANAPLPFDLRPIRGLSGHSEIRSTSTARFKPLFISKSSYPGFPDNWDSPKLSEFLEFSEVYNFREIHRICGICNFPETYEFAKFP
jgi:hypothetical protein